MTGSGHRASLPQQPQAVRDGSRLFPLGRGVVFPPLLFSALAFAKLTLPSVQKYVALALFVGLVVLRNVPAIYAAVEILPRS